MKRKPAAESLDAIAVVRAARAYGLSEASTTEGSYLREFLVDVHP